MAAIGRKGAHKTVVGLDKQHPSFKIVKEIFLLSQIPVTSCSKTFINSINDAVENVKLNNDLKIKEKNYYA